jgi:AcrR family transcriptional regulator
MPKIVDKDAKKMDILHAAMRVFSQKGVIKTKMIDIAIAAGVGKGTIYEYFRSKEEIFATAFSYFFENMSSSINQALNDEKDPLRQLKLLVDKSFDAILHGEDDFAEIMMDFWAEGVRNKNEDVLQSINLKAIYAEYRNMVKQILENGIASGVFRPIDTHTAASVFIGSFDGIMLQWILDRTAINLPKVTEVLIDSFVNGVIKKEK